MKRWQTELMAVMLLTLAFVYLVGPNAILLVPILWLAGRGIAVKAAGERLLRTAIRLFVAIFAAVGWLIAASQATQAMRFLPSLPELLDELGLPVLLVGAIPISFIAFSCLFLYWLEDAYDLVPLEGAARTILRGVVSLILAIVGTFIFAGAYITLCEFLVQPADGSTYFGWVPLLFLGYAVSFNVTWKMLPQRDPRYTARLSA